MTATTSLPDFLIDQLVDPHCGWSIGAFGVIAEFTRGADEAVALTRGFDAISAVTARGGLRVEAPPDLRPIASESLTAQSWSQRVALCLPGAACAMNRRTVLTEVGPDADALCAEDGGGILFDLGLGTLQIDACIRTGDAAVIAALRGYVGQSLFGAGMGAMSVILTANPHRVFSSRAGQAEVFQLIPPPQGESPDGPHTHVLPKLLLHKRTHAATEPLPAGWIPCAHVYPPHPLRDAFGRRRPFQAEHHAAFQSLLARFGDARLVEIKRRVVEAVAAGEGPSDISPTGDRFSRAAVRIALRQLRAADAASPALPSWLAQCDNFDPADAEDATEHPCTA